MSIFFYILLSEYLKNTMRNMEFSSKEFVP